MKKLKMILLAQRLPNFGKNPLHTLLTFILLKIRWIFTMSFAVKEPAHKISKPDKIKGAKIFKISNYLEFKAIPISIIALIISFAYSGVLTFIPIYAEQINLVNAASFYFIVFAVQSWSQDHSQAV